MARPGRPDGATNCSRDTSAPNDPVMVLRASCSYLDDFDRYAACVACSFEGTLQVLISLEPMANEATPSTRTLRRKVKREAYAWPDAAAIEVNQVWNWANSTSTKAARPLVGSSRWLAAYDLDRLSAGAAACCAGESAAEPVAPLAGFQ